MSRHEKVGAKEPLFTAENTIALGAPASAPAPPLPRTMVKLAVSISEEAFDRLEALADAHPSAVSDYISEFLAWCAFNVGDHRCEPLILQKEHVDALAAVLSPPIISAEALVEKARTLKGIGFAGVDIAFTPAQLEEIKQRAVSWGLSEAEYVQALWRRVAPYFFTNL